MWRNNPSPSGKDQARFHDTERTAPDLARGYQTYGTPRFNDRWRVEATLAAMTLRLVPRPNRQRPDTASAPVPRRRLTANKHPAHRVA